MNIKNVFARTSSVFLLILFFSLSVFAKNTTQLDIVEVASLPREAQSMLVLIKQGGPFPYEKDGAVFGNYESKLPKQKRGYYHEYTVKTPRAHNRGARRIIAGGQPMTSGEYYYTDDHYDSFKKIRQ
ncbi:MAG: ribonuclease [Pseudomonadota bacterium]